jgi:hypothetical protein
MNGRRLDIDRAALFLMRRYGNDCAVVAFHRSRCCARQRLETAERDWRLVLRRVIELHFANPRGPVH